MRVESRLPGWCRAYARVPGGPTAAHLATRRHLYAAHLNLAFAAWSEGNLARARELLHPDQRVFLDRLKQHLREKG
jgi:hypothetical protein